MKMSLVIQFINIKKEDLHLPYLEYLIPYQVEIKEEKQDLMKLFKPY